MALKITVKGMPKSIPRPTLSEVVILKKKQSEKQVLVFLCPTPSGNYCLFVGDCGNSYLPESEWERFVSTAYDFVHSASVHSMEVTFNA